MYLHVLLLLTLVSGAIGQSPVWEQDLGGPGTDFATSVAGEGETIFVASYYSPDSASPDFNGGIDVLVSRMDMEGNVAWSKCFGGPGDDDPTRILLDPEGYLLVIGSTSSTEGIFPENLGETDGFVMKIDPQGELQWAMQLGGAQRDFLLSGAVSDQGDIFLAGVTESSLQGMENRGHADGWVARITAGGVVAWQKSYGGSYNDLLRGIGLVGDTLLVVCGHTRSDDHDITGFTGSPGGRYGNGWVMVLDTAGRVEEQYCHGDAGSSDGAFSTLCIRGDGRIVVGGQFSTFTDPSWPGNYRTLLMEYAGTGGLTEAYRGKDGGNQQLSQAVEDARGRLCLAGSATGTAETLYEPDRPSGRFLTVLDAAFETIWEQQWETTRPSACHGLIPTSDGKLIACGSKENGSGESPGKLDAFVMKICPATRSTEEIMLCLGDTLEIGGRRVAGPGTFADTLAATNGCDSLVVYQVSMLASYHFNEYYPGLCNEDLSLHDTLVSTSGYYLFPFETGFHCDSIFACTVEITSTTNEVVVDGSTITALQEDAEYQWFDCATNGLFPGPTAAPSRLPSQVITG